MYRCASVVEKQKSTQAPAVPEGKTGQY